MNFVFDQDAWVDSVYWQTRDRRVLKRIKPSSVTSPGVPMWASPTSESESRKP